MTYKVLCRLYKGAGKIEEFIIFSVDFEKEVLYQLYKGFIPTSMLYIED